MTRWLEELSLAAEQVGFAMAHEFGFTAKAFVYLSGRKIQAKTVRKLFGDSVTNQEILSRTPIFLPQPVPLYRFRKIWPPWHTLIRGLDNSTNAHEQTHS